MSKHIHISFSDQRMNKETLLTLNSSESEDRYFYLTASRLGLKLGTLSGTCLRFKMQNNHWQLVLLGVPRIK